MASAPTRPPAGRRFLRKKKGKKYLTYSHMGMYCAGMARAATTSDAFNAVAEPRRRAILNYLALQERPVGEIVDLLGMEQPSVSKHLSSVAQGGPRQRAARRPAHALSNQR